MDVEVKKPARKSTPLIPEYPAWGREKMGCSPNIGATSDEEAFHIATELEKVLIIDGWTVESKEGNKGPSAEMMKNLSSDNDRPVLRDQMMGLKLSDVQVRK